LIIGSDLRKHPRVALDEWLTSDHAVCPLVPNRWFRISTVNVSVLRYVKRPNPRPRKTGARTCKAALLKQSENHRYALLSSICALTTSVRKYAV